MNATTINQKEKTVSETIAHRHSPLAYSHEAVSHIKLEKVLKAAQWSASAFNEQPWRFIIGERDKGDSHEKVLLTLAEPNQLWARHAPVLIIAVYKKDFTQFENPNNHGAYDTGQAMSALALQAAALDLHVHQMAGFSAEKAKSLFNIPDGFQPIAAAALGYKGAIEDLPESLHARAKAPRKRKDLSEIAFLGDWGQSWK